MILLSNRQRPIVFNVIQGLFNSFKNRSYRYFNRFYFDNGNKINSLLQTWLQTISTFFNTSKRVTPKLGLHRSKDRQWSKVLKGVTTGKDGFKDSSS